MLDKFHVVTPEFTRPIFSALSPNSTDSGWTYLFSGIFAEFMPVGLSLPAAGWKLRVNARLEDATRLLRSVVPVLRREKLAFKVLADPTLYRFGFSKQIQAEAGGKFLTIYIPRPEDLRRIAKELAVLIEQLAVDPSAPPISDAPVRFSKNISYRFGSYTNADFVKDGDGNLVEDCREFFRLPVGVKCPFSGIVGESDDDATEQPVEIGNYEIESVLHRTYPSAVYLGTRKSDGLKIICKESRPYAYVQDILATDLLENEYLMLREIAASGCSEICPTPLELFQVEQHSFLTMTRIPDPVSLYEWRQQNRNPDAHFRIGQKIAEVLVRLHSELSIAWGDIHASNVLVDDSEMRVYFIDPEFAKHTKHTRDFTRDIQMYGRLLLWLVFSDVDMLFEPDCYPDVFLQRFERRSDYNPAYIDAVHSALSGRIDPVNLGSDNPLP